MQPDISAYQPATSVPILVVDDDPIFREQVARFLRRHQFVPLEAGDAQSAYEMAAAHRPVAAIVDIVLPERPFARPIQGSDQGIELARRLKVLDPAIGVVIISAFGDRSDAVLKLTMNGTRGIAYLVKGARSGTNALLQALDEVRAGHILIRSDEPSRSVIWEERFWAGLSPRETPYVLRAVEQFPTLTKREVEVANTLAHAQTVEGTARELNIAQGTAEKHINSLYGKLELYRADHEDPPLRKSILLAKVCWLIDMLRGRDEP